MLASKSCPGQQPALETQAAASSLHTFAIKASGTMYYAASPRFSLFCFALCQSCFRPVCFPSFSLGSLSVAVCPCPDKPSSPSTQAASQAPPQQQHSSKSHKSVSTAQSRLSRVSHFHPPPPSGSTLQMDFAPSSQPHALGISTPPALLLPLASGRDITSGAQ